MEEKEESRAKCRRMLKKDAELPSRLACFGLGGSPASRSVHVIISIAVFEIRLAGRLPKTTSTIHHGLVPFPHLRIVKSFVTAEVIAYWTLEWAV